MSGSTREKRVGDGSGLSVHRYLPPPSAAQRLLVRHGEAPADPDEPFSLGARHGDPDVGEQDREQAAMIAERPAGEPLDAVHVSTLARTHQTAEPLLARLGIEPIVEPDPEARPCECERHLLAAA